MTESATSVKDEHPTTERSRLFADAEPALGQPGTIALPEALGELLRSGRLHR
jgi:hypothetical protein